MRRRRSVRAGRLVALTGAAVAEIIGQSLV
jgi:hypothetical protein